LDRFIKAFRNGYVQGEMLSPNGRTGAVFVEGNVHESARGLVDRDKIVRAISTQAERIDEGIYCGYLVPLFGHFITEFLPRYEQVRMAGGTPKPILVHPVHFLVDPPGQLSRSNLVAQFLNVLDLPFEQLRFCTSDVAVDRLYCTTNIFKLSEAVDEKIVEISKSLNGRFPVGGREKKIFLSRSRLKEHHRKAINSLEVDKIFFERGFEVLHPQEMRLRDQIVAVCSARVLAGEEGSALHLSMFNPFLEACIILDSGRLTKPGALPDTQRLLNERLGCRTVYCQHIENSGTTMQSGGRFLVDIQAINAVLAEFS